MPFLADRRVVVVNDAQTLKAQPRRDLWAVAQEVPDGNTTLIILGYLLSSKSKRPETLRAGWPAGAATADRHHRYGEDARLRFKVTETLERLRMEPRPIRASSTQLVRSEAGASAAVRNDLEKLALTGKKITIEDLEGESLSIEDPKAYKYASALVEGKVAEAMSIAHECFANDPRGSAMPLLSALATECQALWEMARDGGELPARMRWRERMLRPLAKRVGERRARAAFERAVRGIESIVTGKIGSDPADHQTLVERISVEVSGMSRPAR